MSFNINDAISNPTGPTGPRTLAGKAIASRNSLKVGLFTAHDFIREGEHEEYAQIATALRIDINPEGALQELLTGEIVGATWRLRRCGLVEASLITESGLDPMADDAATGKTQKSVDRARAQSHSIIRRAIAELRKMQTQESIRTALELDAEGLEDTAAVLRAVKRFGAKPDPVGANPFASDANDLDMNNPEDFAAMDQFLMTSPLASPAFAEMMKKIATPKESTPSSFCKPAAPPAPTPARNAPCPCGSTLKYKRCCGGPAAHNEKHVA